MSEQKKPRLAELLGVEVNERFSFVGDRLQARYLFVDGDGCILWNVGPLSVSECCEIINHPECVVRIPRLTKPELAIMRDVGARWVSRDTENSIAILWEDKPHLTENGYEGAPVAAMMYGQRFSSVCGGDCICVDEGTDG